MSMIVRVSAEGTLTVGCDDEEVVVAGSFPGKQPTTSDPVRKDPGTSGNASGWPQDSAPDTIRKKRPRPADGNPIGASAQLVVQRRRWPHVPLTQLSSRDYRELHDDVAEAIRHNSSTSATRPLALSLGLKAGDVFDVATALEVVRHAAESQNCQSVVLCVFVRGQ